MHGNWVIALRLKSIGKFVPHIFSYLHILYQMLCIKFQIAGQWMFRWTSFRRKFSSMNWERVLLPNSGDQSVSVIYQLIAKLIFELIMLGLWDGEQLRFKLFQVGAPWVTLMVWSQFDEEDLLQQNVDDNFVDNNLFISERMRVSSRRRRSRCQQMICKGFTFYNFEINQLNRFATSCMFSLQARLAPLWVSRVQPARAHRRNHLRLRHPPLHCEQPLPLSWHHHPPHCHHHTLIKFKHYFLSLTCSLST